jgi:hypothetical protein
VRRSRPRLTWPRWMLAVLDVDAVTAAGGKAAEAVALLALVAGQDVEPAAGFDGTDGRWRIARKTAPDRVIPPSIQRLGTPTRPGSAARTGSKSPPGG